jgi:hypothetical protein
MDRPPPPAFLYFPYLGVGYGTVTAESAAALDKQRAQNGAPAKAEAHA